MEYRPLIGASPEMKDRDTIPLIEKLADALQRERPTAPAAARLAGYVQQVATWNRRVGLIAAASPEARVELLLADALVIASEQVVPRGSRLLDVGAGAGAPTLPLLLLRDDLSAVLVESRRKRVAFLRTAAEKLGLTDRARVVEKRIDPQHPGPDDRGFDVALSRATFAPEIWMAAGVKMARQTLVFTARKSPPEPPPEAEQAQSLNYRLPGSGAARRVTLYRSV